MEPSSGIADAQVQELHRVVEAAVGDRIELELKVVERLENPANGKERLVDQRIPGVSSTWA